MDLSFCACVMYLYSYIPKSINANFIYGFVGLILVQKINSVFCYFYLTILIWTYFCFLTTNIKNCLIVKSKYILKVTFNKIFIIIIIATRNVSIWQYIV